MTALGTGIAQVLDFLPGIANVISPQTYHARRISAAGVVYVQQRCQYPVSQGMPVPIAYGRLFVGSAVLSSGLDVDQKQHDTDSNTFKALVAAKAVAVTTAVVRRLTTLCSRFSLPMFWT